MNSNENLNLKGQHALFSPSQPSWLNYDTTDTNEFIWKFIGKFRSNLGTEIHGWAASQIELGQKVTSVKEAIKDIKSYIYNKYYSEKYGLSDYGSMLLRCFIYIPYDVISTVRTYINDAVGFKMKTEQVIYYSEYFFGTCDAIKVDKNLIRIHDLKTGSMSADMNQLIVYASLYCLSKDIDPYKIPIELRIYQSDDILILNPTGDEIVPVMDKITKLNNLCMKFKGGLL